MSSRPWYRWYPADFLQDTLHMSPMAELYYRRLLDVLWSHGPLPDDERTLSRATRSGIKSWRRSAPEILPLMQHMNGLIDHPKLSKQRDEAVEIIEKRRKAGKARQAAHAPAHAPAHAVTKTTPPPAGARPDPDPYKDLPPLYASALKPDPPARAREATAPDAKSETGLTDEQRQQAAAIQAALEQRREAEHVNGGGGPVKLRASLPKSESESGGDERKAGEDT